MITCSQDFTPSLGAQKAPGQIMGALAQAKGRPVSLHHDPGLSSEGDNMRR